MLPQAACITAGAAGNFKQKESCGFTFFDREAAAFFVCVRVGIMQGMFQVRDRSRRMYPRSYWRSFDR